MFCLLLFLAAVSVAAAQLKCGIKAGVCMTAIATNYLASSRANKCLLNKLYNSLYVGGTSITQ